MTEESTIIIYCDGASRGNPGPAASAFLVKAGEQILYQTGQFLGNTTNNVAEYQAVINALTWINQQITNNHSKFTNISFLLDSQLVVRQLNGQYRIKQPHLIQLANHIKTLRHQITEQGTTTTFTHIPRHQNNIADGLANQTLDQQPTLQA